MGVYIKGMNMPKDFFRCPFAVIGKTISRTHCRVDARKPKYCCGVGRPDCPLVEVKEPHGDLIDRDALMKKADAVHSYDGSGMEYEYKAVSDLSIADAPTVLEAEE